MPRMGLKILGGFELTDQKGKKVALTSRKGQALLTYLALNAGKYHGRGELAALLWGNRGEIQARASLKSCLLALRKATADRVGELVEADRNGVTLHGEAIRVDATQLRLLAESDDIEELAVAARLYEGELLAGIATSEEAFEEWLLIERAAIRKTALEALSKLALGRLEHGEAEAAVAAAEKLAALDPLNEKAHRLLMRALDQTGRRSAALEQYQACKELLERELGVEPEAKTTALYEGIRSDASDSGSLEVISNNLPTSVSSFVGRQTEIAEIVELLGTTRLLTIVGTGGSGKTRLSLEVAAEVLGGYSNGAWFVDLAGLTDPELVPRQVAWSLGLSEKAGRKWSENLRAFVSDRELLLVLDNCEHLIRAVADLTMDLLRGSPKLKVLATSREVLNLSGEVTWQIPLLSNPSHEESAEIDDLMGYESVQLFVERARAVRVDVGLQDEDADAVARICRRLDGLPLALELAAALVRTFSVQQIVRHLDDRFSLLTGGSRTAPPRQQTLRAAVSWSYELLSPEERQLFERVSVFAGGFGFEAALKVADGAAFDGIASLVDKSLLVARPDGEDMRYQMLETISAFGLERLDDKISDAKDAHFAWAVNLAHEAAAHLEGPRQTEWLNKVETELRNFRAAMQWGIDSDQPASGLEIASALYRYWWFRGIREGSLWLDSFLSLSEEMPDNIMATGLYVAGSLDQVMGKYEQAAQRLERSLAIFRKLGDRRSAAYALHYMMRAQWRRIDPKKIREMIDTALTEFRHLEEANGVATSLVFVTFWELDFGDPDRALDVASDLEAACELTGSTHQIAHGLELPAIALMQLRKYETARPRLHKALKMYRQIGNQQCAAHCLENTAGWALGNGQPESSVVLLGATDAFRTDIGVPCPPFESLLFEDTLKNAKAAIGRAAFESAWQQGQALDITKALETAIRVTEDDPKGGGR